MSNFWKVRIRFGYSISESDISESEQNSDIRTPSVANDHPMTIHCRRSDGCTAASLVVRGTEWAKTTLHPV